MEKVFKKQKKVRPLLICTPRVSMSTKTKGIPREPGFPRATEGIRHVSTWPEEGKNPYVHLRTETDGCGNRNSN